ncbi:helix-turn-helix domain-containing protein [Lactococcus garvieae]|uniref:helix-turn-helix domain-containing protein n=1 Tax=Lactococcus garvieae TaxID=1363 RepID=UPI00398E4327
MVQNRIKPLRKTKNMTLINLRDKVNAYLKDKNIFINNKLLQITDSQLSQYENGKRSPRNGEIWQALSEIFDVPTAYVMGLTSEVEKTVDIYNNGAPIPNDIIELGTGEFDSLIERVKVIAKQGEREKKLKKAVDKYLDRETTEDEFAGLPLLIDMIGTEIYEHLQWIILISTIDKRLTHNKIEYLEKEIQKLKKK